MVDYKVGFKKESRYEDHAQNIVNQLKKYHIQVGNFVYVPNVSSTRGFHQKVQFKMLVWVHQDIRC